MATYYSYEIDSAFLNADKTIKWTLTGNGEFFIGAKEGKRYFIKRNINIRKPVRSTARALYLQQKEGADYVEKKQKRLTKAMCGLNTKDGVLTEISNFWDNENKFVTVTNYIEGCDQELSFISRYDLASICSIYSFLADRVSRLHSCGVIHGDLKEKNFLFKRVKGGLEIYILDFDNSFLADSVPDYYRLPDSEGYQSPEITSCLYNEDNSLRRNIGYATDIFSLGIIFHKLWTGAFPRLEIERGSTAVALCLGKAVHLNEKLDVQIGPNYGSTLMSLINWMIAKEPGERPTAKQVKNVLCDKEAVPKSFKIGKAGSVIQNLWSEHAVFAELNIKKLEEAGITDFRSVNDGGNLKYLVTQKGVREILSINELSDKGFVKFKPLDLDSPWPEDEIVMVDPDAISAKGYVSIKRKDSSNGHVYVIKTRSGLTFSKSKNWLVTEGLATYNLKKNYSSDTPWPEHGGTYAEGDVVTKLKIKKIYRLEYGGEHAYGVEYQDGTNVVVKHRMMLIMGLIK